MRLPFRSTWFNIDPNMHRINIAVKGFMAKAVKRRKYDSSARKAAAQFTRQSIIDAARRVFMQNGYAGATMPAIAREAGIALDTVYAAVGKKPTLLRLLVETAISGRDRAVDANERDYVRAIRVEPDAEQKLKIYAAALRAIQPRLAPIFKVLRAAAMQDAELSTLWQEISQRRAANMLLLARNLAETGRLRRDLSIPKVADIIWSLSSPEFYLLLVEERGWSTEDFEHWLADAWARLLLETKT
jgi:AcrR family transcriptional regulator